MWAIPSFADDATTPADKGPVLQVAVIDSDTKNSLTYAFTMAMLQSMLKTSYSTNTIWTEGGRSVDRTVGNDWGKPDFGHRMGHQRLYGGILTR